MLLDEQISSIRKNISHRLIHVTISSMVHRCHTLTNELYNLRNKLRDSCNNEDCRKICTVIYQLNAYVYDLHVNLKRNKLASLALKNTAASVPQTQVPSAKLVVNVSEDLSLTEHERPELYPSHGSSLRWIHSQTISWNVYALGVTTVQYQILSTRPLQRTQAIQEILTSNL